MKFAFHPEADEEFHAAIDYYERCEFGLGQDFSLEIYATIQNIVSYPMAWPILDSDVRRCICHRFPYGILYSIEPDVIYILSVMNLHRHPDSWQHRITPQVP